MVETDGPLVLTNYFCIDTNWNKLALYYTFFLLSLTQVQALGAVGVCAVQSGLSMFRYVLSLSDRAWGYFHPFRPQQDRLQSQLSLSDHFLGVGVLRS